MDSITKICTKCLETKSLSEFGKSNKSKDGKRADCKICHNLESRKWQIEHPEETKQRRLKAYAAHPEKQLIRSILWRRAHPEDYKKAQQKSREKHRSKIKAKYKEQRDLIINAYGGKCSCCGESAREFLAIDHVNGGGGKERKATSMRSIFSKIIKANFPPDYRLLCHNCNLSLGFYGYCPHKK